MTAKSCSCQYCGKAEGPWSSYCPQGPSTCAMCDVTLELLQATMDKVEKYMEKAIDKSIKKMVKDVSD